MTSQPSRCVIEVRRIDGAAVVAVRGTVDALTAPQLEEAIAAAGARAPAAPWGVVVGVVLAASTGLGGTPAPPPD
ncbi:hypothetical protein AB4Z39_20490, partial [Mycobacterium adipatum]